MFDLLMAALSNGAIWKPLFIAVALGALFVFGNKAAVFAQEHNLALESIVQLSFGLWPPAECPLCKTGVAVEKVSDAVGHGATAVVCGSTAAAARARSALEAAGVRLPEQVSLVAVGCLIVSSMPWARSRCFATAA